MSCKVATESCPSREIRALNRLRELRNPSRFVAGWKKSLSQGRTFGLESGCLWEVVWLWSRRREMPSYRRLRRLRNGFPTAGSCSYHWTRVVILIGVDFDHYIGVCTRSYILAPLTSLLSYTFHPLLLLGSCFFI